MRFDVLGRSIVDARLERLPDGPHIERWLISSPSTRNDGTDLFGDVEGVRASGSAEASRDHKITDRLLATHGVLAQD